MIVVTTPSGNIGHQVLDNLLTSNVQGIRVIARDPSELPHPVLERVEVVEGAHGDSDVVDTAYAGADAVLPPGVTGTACRFSKSLFVAGAADVVVPVLDVPSVLGGMT